MSTPTSSIKLQLQRLRRHYDAAVKGYDPITLLDLSHSLRIWADLRTEFPKQYAAAHTTLTFKRASPSKQFLRAVKDLEYSVSLIAGDVDVPFREGMMLVAAKSKMMTEKGTTLGYAAMYKGDRVKLRSVTIIQGGMDIDKNVILDNHPVDRTNFTGYLDSVAVRMNYRETDGSLRPVSISVKDMITRVANSLDGSHPSDNYLEARDKPHPLDDVIKSLFVVDLAELPLPYFILLKIAQDILAFATPMVDGVTASAG